jgi:hypothetical protein
MPIDPRIPLQAIGIQAPDFLGAMRQGQEYRQNQMAQRAAEATAARNAMIQQRAAQTDFGDPTAVRNFAALGPGTEDFLSSVTAGDSMFTARDTNRRAEGKFATEQDEAGMVELRTVVGRVFANPDDASLADAAQRYPQFAADINRIAASPDAAARRTGLATLVASLPGGSDFLKAVTENYVRTNMGDRSIVDQTNPYAPGFTPPVEQQYGESPNRPQYITGDDGTVYRVSSSGPATRVPVEGGGTLTERVPGTAPTATQQADELKREVALSTINSGATSLLADFGILRSQGYMRTKALNPLQNFGLGIRQIFPMVEGMARSVNPAADAAAGRIQGTISSMISQLRNVTGGTAREIDAVKELELALAQLGNSSGNYEASVDLVRALQARMAVVQSIYDEGGFRGDAGGGGGGTPSAPAGGGQVAYDTQGNRFVVRNGQWVRE